MSTNPHADACRQYSLDTLEAICRDLQKNPNILRKGSWEQTRLTAIRREIQNRRKALA